MTELQTTLDLMPSKPMAKATNRGNNYLIEFAIPVPKPKDKRKGTWARANQIL